MTQNKKRLVISLNHNIFVGLLFIFVIFSGGVVSAINSDVARWYFSDENLEAGSIVSIKSEKGNFVERAVSGSSTALLGVVVSEDQASISIDKQQGDTQVAIAGRAEVRVSNANGPIARGELVGLSNESGVGAKAKEGQPVVGVAESSFGNETNQDGEQNGLMPIIVSVGVAPSSTNEASSTTTWLKSVAGKDVSALQIAFVFFIAIVGIIAISFLSYSSIRNGVRAIGRNPLAKPVILRALSQSMIMVSLIAICCFSLMYFMLRL